MGDGSAPGVMSGMQPPFRCMHEVSKKFPLCCVCCMCLAPWMVERDSKQQLLALP